MIVHMISVFSHNKNTFQTFVLNNIQEYIKPYSENMSLVFVHGNEAFVSKSEANLKDIFLGIHIIHKRELIENLG